MNDKQAYMKHLWASLKNAIREGDIDNAIGYAKGIADNENPKFSHRDKRAIVIFVQACEMVVK